MCVRALREIDFGQWEGLRWEEIEERDKAYSREWIAAYPRMASPGGEDIGRFERRVLEEVEFLSLEAERAARTIAVVTHAGVIRTVLCAFAWVLRRERMGADKGVLLCGSTSYRRIVWFEGSHGEVVRPTVRCTSRLREGFDD